MELHYQAAILLNEKLNRLFSDKPLAGVLRNLKPSDWSDKIFGKRDFVVKAIGSDVDRARGWRAVQIWLSSPPLHPNSIKVFKCEGDDETTAVPVLDGQQLWKLAQGVIAKNREALVETLDHWRVPVRELKSIAAVSTVAARDGFQEFFLRGLGEALSRSQNPKLKLDQYAVGIDGTSCTDQIRRIAIDGHDLLLVYRGDLDKMLREIYNVLERHPKLRLLTATPSDFGDTDRYNDRRFHFGQDEAALGDFLRQDIEAAFDKGLVESGNVPAVLLHTGETTRSLLGARLAPLGRMVENRPNQGKLFVPDAPAHHGPADEAGAAKAVVRDFFNRSKSRDVKAIISGWGIYTLGVLEAVKELPERRRTALNVYSADLVPSLLDELWDPHSRLIAVAGVDPFLLGMETGRNIVAILSNSGPIRGEPLKPLLLSRETVSQLKLYTTFDVWARRQEVEKAEDDRRKRSIS